MKGKRDGRIKRKIEVVRDGKRDMKKEKRGEKGGRKNEGEVRGSKKIQKVGSEGEERWREIRREV